MNMETLRYEAAENLNILLRRMDSDTAIRGWDQDTVELTLDGSSDQCTVKRDDDTLTIDSRVAVSIYVPASVTVQVEQVEGDLLLRNLDGSIALGTVHGDLSWRSGKAHLSVETVHGNLAAEKVNGPLSVGEAHGDVRLTGVPASDLGRVHGDVRAYHLGELRMGSVSGDVRADEVTGRLSLEEGHGDFEGKALSGGINVHAVKGDLTLRTNLTPGLTYSGRAGGDVRGRFPAESSARFTLEAKGEISARLPQTEEEKPGRLVGQSGTGEAEVALVAGGDISIKIAGKTDDVAKGISTDWGETLSAQIEAEIAAAMREVDGEIADAMRVAQVESRRGIEEAMREVEREVPKAMREVEREIAKAKRRADKEAARAQRRARIAREKATRKAEIARVKVARKARQGGGFFGPEPAVFVMGHVDRGPAVSEEEQLAVLKMLQEGKISAQEAEMLLQALEG